MLENENKVVEAFQPQVFWDVVEGVWPETRIFNKKDDLGTKAQVLIALCPLYAQGELYKSTLIKYPDGIKESRVASKFVAYASVLNKMSEYLHKVGLGMDLKVVLSNKGVLLDHEPEQTDFEALKYHEEVYKSAFFGFCQTKGISLTFSNYNEAQVNFPTFIQTDQVLPEGLKKELGMIACLNSYLELPAGKIVDNKDNRHLVKRLLEKNGFNVAFWLIAGYLVFDYKIPEIIGEKGIYMVSERMEALFGLAKFTKTLYSLSRIQLKS